VGGWITALNEHYSFLNMYTFFRKSAVTHWKIEVINIFKFPDKT
jgi:hypothetical protein